MLATVLTLLLGVSCGWAQAPIRYTAPEEKSLREREISKPAFIGSGVSATFGTIINHPHEWGRTLGGFGKRFAGAFGKHLVKTSVQYGVAAVRHEELSYQPSGEQRFAPRLRHAMLSTVITRKTTTGEKTIATSRLAGAAAGGFTSRLWMPARYHTVASGVGSMGVSLGVDTGINVLREFWPDIRHRRPAYRAQSAAPAGVRP
jgi:hypothetical protein